MDTTLSMGTFTVQMPKADLTILKSLGKRLGWKITTGSHAKKTDYEQSIDDIEHGRVTEYASVDDMLGK